MNYLNDFDFFSGYSYTYCFSHLEKDGWSRQAWEQAVNLYKKKLKALEIIKEKRVFIGELLQSDSLEEYNDYVEEQGRYDEDKLTQEEYELLKEILKNE